MSKIASLGELSDAIGAVAAEKRLTAAQKKLQELRELNIRQESIYYNQWLDMIDDQKAVVKELEAKPQ